MNRHRSIAVLLCAAVLTSCGLFDETAVRDITGPIAAARVKFFNFGVTSPGVNFYAGDLKMTAISSTTCAVLTDANRDLCSTVGAESTTGVIYGGAGSGGLYVSIAPGENTFSGRIAAATDKDLGISSVTATIENGKFYSFYQSGLYNSTAKTVDAFIVEDPIPSAVDFSVAHVRFVNAISNGTGDLNLFGTNTATTTETALGGAVAYKSAGAFVSVPAGIYNLRAAYTGAGTSLITRNTLSFIAGRVYTITARGSTATASTRALDYTENQR